MKNINDLIKNNKNNNYTLNELIDEYKELNSLIEKSISIKNDYEKQQNNDKFSFKEQLDLYNIINILIDLSYDKQYYMGIDLVNLKDKFENEYKNVINYINLNNRIYSLQIKRKELLDKINFNKFNNDCDKHYLVRIDNEIKCLSCGATTKDYSLNKDELDFLTACADNQGLLIKDIKKEDIPFLKVQIKRQNNNKKQYKKIINKYIEDDYFGEDAWLTEISKLSMLEIMLERAHLFDSKEYNNKDTVINNPKYFTQEKTNELLSEVEKELNKLKNNKSKNKELMIEECNTAKYEILILSGEHIPTLYENAKSEEERIALVKAYYNLSNPNFRTNSEYFDSKESALFYYCLTADQDINNKILQIKK